MHKITAFLVSMYICLRIIILFVVLVVQAVGELLSYRNIPLLNWVSTGQSISNKMVLDTYIRTMAPISSLGESTWSLELKLNSSNNL